MKIPDPLTAVLLLWAGAAGAQTTVISAMNAAGESASVPSNAVAPGSMLSVQVVRGTLVPINPDPEKLAVRLRPADSSVAMDAPVLASSFGTTLALVPRDVPLGAAEIILTYDGQSSAPTPIRIAAVAVGLFVRGQGGFGSVLAHNVRDSAEVVLNRMTAPALSGDYITLWGTGLGNATDAEVTVEIGGVSAAPSYAGPAPGFPGLDQINVPLPSGAPAGCYVSVVVRARDSISNEGVLSTARQPGACEHPFGLGEQELRALELGGGARLALAAVRSDIAAGTGGSMPAASFTRNESARVEFATRDAFMAGVLSQPLLIDEAYFSCRLMNPAIFARFSLVEDIDAGNSLTLTGPDRVHELTLQSVPGLYARLFPPSEPVVSPDDLPQSVFPPGNWELRGSGGRTLGPFQVSFELPPPIRWTNRNALAEIERSVDQIVEWNADGYSMEDVMTVTLTSGFFQQSLPEAARASAVLCRTPASRGRAVLPAGLLQQIPRNQGGALELRIAPRPWGRQRFEAPKTAGGTEKAVLDYSFSESRRVAIR